MKVLVAMAAAVLFALPAVAQDTVTECDRLASHGSDPDRIAPGVSEKDMAKAAAIAACTIDVEKDPDNPRLQYQLGRAYFYSGMTPEAMPHLEIAAAAGHEQAQFVLGYILDGGRQGVTQDRCRAADLWLKSARQDRFAALTSYPHHVMRGYFEGCAIDASVEEMDQFLAKAKTMAADYYQRTWVADLIEDFDAYKKGAK